MKKKSHIINIILSIILGTLGIIMIINKSNFMTEKIMGGATSIFAILFIILGVLLPKDERELSEKERKIALGMTAINSVTNEATVNSVAIDTILGRKKIKRSWEPVAVFIVGIVLGIIGIFAIGVGTDNNRKIAIAIMIVMVLLFIFTFSWKVLDNKEHYGEAKIGGILIPMVIVLTIFSAAGIYGRIKTEHDLSKSPLVRTTKKIEMNKQENKNPKVNVYTIDQLFKKISNDFDRQKLYYSLQNKDEENINLILWKEADDKVYIYILKKIDDNRYQIDTSMVSNSLKYKDVKGKEDGIIK